MPCNPDLEFVDNFAVTHRIWRLWALGSAVLRFVCGLFFGSFRKIYHFWIPPWCVSRNLPYDVPQIAAMAPHYPEPSA